MFDALSSTVVSVYVFIMYSTLQYSCTKNHMQGSGGLILLAMQTLSSLNA